MGYNAATLETSTLVIPPVRTDATWINMFQILFFDNVSSLDNDFLT